jgi:hypothetical protein
LFDWQLYYKYNGLPDFLFLNEIIIKILKFNPMRKVFMLLIICVALTPAIYAHSSFSGKTNVIQSLPEDTTYRIIPSEGNTYGYEILVKNKLLIYQTNIPGMPGNKGFVKKSDAEKVARLAIKKMQKGIMPPTIEKRELDSLKIKF